MIYIFINVCWYKYDTKKAVKTQFHSLNKNECKLLLCALNKISINYNLYWL